jgi:DNA-binding protein H-NS
LGRFPLRARFPVSYRQTEQVRNNTRFANSGNDIDMPRAKTKTYEQIRKEIAELEREADNLKSKEIAGVVARIKEAIAAYGLTAADLGLARKGNPAVAVKPAASRNHGKTAVKVAPKYRDGAGNTWAGRGLKPRWLQAAIKTGKTLEDFAIK